ncbi:MAG: PilN family type IVB pilus formation outer membrane protein [Georgfuchsia sp.]
MTFSIKSTVVLAIASILLQACTGYQAVRERADKDFQQKGEQIGAIQNKAFVAPERVSLVQHENRAYVATKSISRDKFDRLPSKFDQVTLRFGERLTIASVAENIQAATGLRVMVHPDVLVDQMKLIPANGGIFSRGSSSASTTTSAATTTATTTSSSPAGVTQPASVGTAQSATGGDFYVDIPVNFSGPLADFLDQLATRLGVDWEYQEGQIDIRRFVTRTFSIVAIPGQNTFTASLGKQGNTAAGTQASGANTSSSSSGTFNSNMNVSLDSTVNYWQSLEGQVTAMLSPLGKIAVNQGSGTITVTDVKDVVDRIGRLLDEENRVVTRQVLFDVQVYTVRGNDGSDFGVDWNLVYSKLSNLTPDWTATLVTPGDLASAAAGQIGISLLHAPSNDAGLSGRLNGSKAFLNALASVAKLSRVTSQKVMTLNRKAAPVAIIDQTAYAAATTPGTTTGTGTASTYGITPGTVTTGFVMNLVPSITDRNSMVLTFSLDISDLKQITNFTSGSGAAAQSIQLPQVSATQFIQNVALKSGETMVITGFEQLTNSYNQRTLGRDVSPGLGGSFSGSQDRQSMVILVTPIIREGL